MTSHERKVKAELARIPRSPFFAFSFLGSSLATRHWLLILLLLGLLLPTGARAQGKVEGTILNGRTHRPVSNLEVRLLMPRGGMQKVATASTDPHGHFAFVQGQIDPGSFYLVSAEFQGVAYNASAQFDSTGAAVVNLTVYDSTRSALALRIRTLCMLARAEGSKIRVQHRYAIENSSQPPRAYANPGQTFRFRLSPQVAEPRVFVTGLMNMPLPQTPEPGKAPGEFSIRYPLKPGITEVTVEYEADYSSAGIPLRTGVPYPIGQAEMYISPSTLSVDSAVFKPAGVDSANGVQKLEAESLPPGVAVEARLSGEPASSAQAEAGQAQDGVTIVPNSMTRFGLPLLACFLLVLLWALGVRVAKEWPKWADQRAASPAQKQLETKVESLLNSLADLDELFASAKIAERNYWKERLELKAKLVAILRKSPPTLLESYAARHIPR